MARRVHILEGSSADGTKLFTCGRKVKGAARCIGRALVVDAAARREVTCALCLERFSFRPAPPSDAFAAARIAAVRRETIEACARAASEMPLCTVRCPQQVAAFIRETMADSSAASAPSGGPPRQQGVDGASSTPSRSSPLPDVTAPTSAGAAESTPPRCTCGVYPYESHREACAWEIFRRADAQHKGDGGRHE